MPGVYKEVRQLRAKVKTAKAAVLEARTLLSTYRDSCEDFLRAHANLVRMEESARPAPHQPRLTKTALEDKRRVETILAEVKRLEAELAGLLGPPA